MIRNKEDYQEYLKADQIALSKKGTIKQRYFDRIWRFQRILRKLEYQTNTATPKLLRLITFIRYKRLSYQLGFMIPPNVFGPGLSIAHPGTIVVSSAARVGANCRIHVCVNIGTEAGKSSRCPTIGDNCYIGPGAKIFGAISIGDNSAIAANAVVNKSFSEGNCTIGGVPARIISDKGSKGLINQGHSKNGPR